MFTPHVCSCLQPLPDISGWTYAGSTKLRDVDAHMWRYSEKQREKVITYAFFTAASNGWPLKLQMMGVNLLTGVGWQSANTISVKCAGADRPHPCGVIIV